MKSGELNKRVTLQIPRTPQDTYGEQIESWVDVATVWAGIITSGSREFYAAQKMNAETSAVIKIRYRAGINTKMRVKYGNRIFEIIGAPDPEERHKELLLSCKEVV